MLVIKPHAAAVAEAAAAIVAGTIQQTRGSTVGLAGGSTPEATYRVLAGGTHDWDRVTLWLGDERWVAPDHPDANAGMVTRILGSAADRLLVPRYDLGDPHAAAADYATKLAAAFADRDGRPDLVVLGIGDDGHTASLFPGTAALDIVDRDYVANWVPAKKTWRLTATLPLLWSARRIVFIVTGEAKSSMIARVLDGAEPFPAQMVAAGSDDVTWLLDEAAASQLKETRR